MEIEHWQHLTAQRFAHWQADLASEAEALYGVKAAFAALQANLADAGRDFLAFADQFEVSLMRVYQAEVGRLPGSDRTKRLRKKRRAALSRWYTARMLEG